MSGHLVILTGAGVSAESGLGTFRDTDGIWSKFDWRELATPEAFAAKPHEVHAFYNARRKNLVTARPNAAHQALAELEAAWIARGGEFLLVTQNVDNLHETAGSERLVHMHGELSRMRCTNCHATGEAPKELSSLDTCSACGSTGTLRPHIVWFGEMPLQMELIYSQLESCNLFVSIGTSGTVYPAAGFSQVARDAGARCIEINLEETDMSPVFHEHRLGKASEAVPAFVRETLAQS
ncbi:NAD-dependent deacylase [Maricaulis sp. D1M11]|uniref:NAD-dependent deacylase n=1 Tax=Maricaulis sp. D1M11 TaxID=3076117 RepID=UPI0039B4050A